MEDFYIDINNQWIAIRFTDFTFIGVYAHGPQKVRTKTWKSLSRLQGPIILMGDFNMVETIQDRYKAKGQTLFGSENKNGPSLRNCFKLQDIGHESSFSWQNYSTGELLTLVL